jgi:hypothetical protein
MQKVHAGHDVVSLFNIASKPRQLSQGNPGALAKVLTVVSAFLVVVVAATVFNFLSQSLESKTRAARALSGEPVAFQPSQAISKGITSGYFGK